MVIHGNHLTWYLKSEFSFQRYSFEDIVLNILLNYPQMTLSYLNSSNREKQRAKCVCRLLPMNMFLKTKEWFITK